MKKIVTRQTVEHVAAVARLDLTEKELKKLEQDLNSILAAFKILDKAPVKGVEASYHPIPVFDVMREDNIEKGFTPEQALGNTDHKERGFFKGPKAI
jgi:aspartyl-tRNA(Asn)/glutamyl-tRNA(Gln) amidotransferase subunit C